MNLPVAFLGLAGLGIVLAVISYIVYRGNRTDDLSMWLAIAAGLLILIGGVTGGTTAGTFYGTQAACRNHGQVMGTPTSYRGLLAGCFIKYQGQWIPYEKWLVITGGRP